MEVSALISRKSERFELSQRRAAAGHECSGSTGGAGGWQLVATTQGCQRSLALAVDALKAAGESRHGNHIGHTFHILPQGANL